MNALANSQDEELGKFVDKGYAEGRSPVRFARYTGQERGPDREAIRSDPPDILLTNYMMLELLLTRTEDRELLRAAQGLRFLVFDELHTYRGRQGADIAMLIRRCRHAVGNSVVCIGTSATMASGGGSEEQRREVAAVSQSLFGVPIAPAQVVTESLERATPEIELADPSIRAAIRAAVVSDEEPPVEYGTFCMHPLASWIESTFGVREEPDTGRLLRQTPRRLEGEPIGDLLSAAAELAALVESDPGRCAEALRRWLLRGSSLRSDSSRFSVFAFRLHQFLTRGDTVWASLEPVAERHLEIAKKAAKPGEPDKPLFPLVFCRRCGTAYYRVWVTADDNDRRLLPREDRREQVNGGMDEAYVHLSEEAPWAAGRRLCAAQSLAGLSQGDDHLGRGTDPFQRPPGRSGGGVRRPFRANRPRGRRCAGGSAPPELPLLPGTVVRSHLHEDPAFGAFQVGHARCGQPEHCNDNPCGTVAHYFAAGPESEP
jgi:ATP-dependent helicase YprA (DUF1998 family)